MKRKTQIVAHDMKLFIVVCSNIVAACLKHVRTLTSVCAVFIFFQVVIRKRESSQRQWRDTEKNRRCIRRKWQCRNSIMKIFLVSVNGRYVKKRKFLALTRIEMFENLVIKELLKTKP